MTFACSRRSWAGVARDGEGSRWKSPNRKNLYLSPYVEEPLNSKVIKSFVPELRSHKCFSCFEIPIFSLSLYIYIYIYEHHERFAYRYEYVNFTYSYLSMIQLLQGRSFGESGLLYFHLSLRSTLLHDRVLSIGLIELNSVLELN